jgi:type IV pilus assembly protein PilA
MISKRNQKGFTLIELMIVVAIIGILAAIAIPAFMEYMNSGKGTEGEIQLNRMGKSGKAYFVKKSEFPQAAGASDPGTDPCDNAGKVYTAADWVVTAGDAFDLMGFSMDDNFRFDYAYASTGPNDFTGTAIADLDCAADGSLTTVTAVGSLSTTGAPSVVMTTVGSD